MSAKSRQFVSRLNMDFRKKSVHKHANALTMPVCFERRGAGIGLMCVVAAIPSCELSAFLKKQRSTAIQFFYTLTRCNKTQYKYPFRALNNDTNSRATLAGQKKNPFTVVISLLLLKPLFIGSKNNDIFAISEPSWCAKR